jgi:hypothetical protein
MGLRVDEASRQFSSVCQREERGALQPDANGLSLTFGATQRRAFMRFRRVGLHFLIRKMFLPTIKTPPFRHGCRNLGARGGAQSVRWKSAPGGHNLEAEGDCVAARRDTGG